MQAITLFYLTSLWGQLKVSDEIFKSIKSIMNKYFLRLNSLKIVLLGYFGDTNV